MAGGTLSGRYEIGDRLGSGGMSNVYKATDLTLERTVAVKILAEHLSDDDRFVARFRREALAVAKLVHPNIVQVYDTGVDDGPPLHRHGVRRGPLRGADTAAAGPDRAGDRRRGRRPGLRRPRLRAPARDHPPRRQARQPDDRRRPRGRRRDDGETDRLRDRPRARPDTDHPGRLGGRHRRLPGPRAGARRGGDAGDRRLRARRRPLPVPHRAPPVRGRRPWRSWRYASRTSAPSPPPPTTTRCRGRSAPRSCGRWRAIPRGATAAPTNWPPACTAACRART